MMLLLLLISVLSATLEGELFFIISFPDFILLSIPFQPTSSFFLSLDDVLLFRLNLIFRLLSHVAGWTGHGSLTDSSVHISNILYVMTDNTDSNLQRKVTVAITEPEVAEIETFELLIYVDDNKVKMKNQGSSKIIELDPPNQVMYTPFLPIISEEVRK